MTSPTNRTGPERRPYVSPLRARQARATRIAILDAAHSLFIELGYAGTSVRRVAMAAGVSESTVFEAFGDKPSILRAVGDRLLAGGPEPVLLEQSAFVNALRAEPDPRRRLEIVMQWATETFERGIADFEELIYEAAAADTRLEGLKSEMLVERHEHHLMLVGLLLDGVALPDGVTLDDVADFVEAVDSAPTYRRLTGERGWTLDKYRRWMTDLIERMFLAPPRA